MDKRSKNANKKKSIRIKVTAWGKNIALVTGIGAVAFFGAKKTVGNIDVLKRFKLEKISVRGICQVDTSDVLSLAAVSLGVPLIETNTKEIGQRIMQNAWIKKARVQRQLPDGILLRIVEREPVALVNAGHIYLVDNEGVMVEIEPGRFMNLPIISGLEYKKTDERTCRLTDSGVSRMNNFFSNIRKSSINIRPYLTQVHFVDDRHIHIKLETNNALIELTDDQAANGIKLLSRLLVNTENNFEKMPKRINLCYSNLAFVR